MPALSILIWIPAAFGVAAALLGAIPGIGLPRRLGGREALPGQLSLLGALITLALSIGYIVEYNPLSQPLTASGQRLAHLTDVNWIPALGIHYKLGVDGLNVVLVGLTALLFAAAILASNVRREQSPGEEAGEGSRGRPPLFYMFMLIAESGVLGAFLAQDLALFVAFFDLMLIPFYFLIGMWSEWPRHERIRATAKLIIYTLVGSLLMLAAAVATGVLASQEHGTHITFVLSSLQHLPVSRADQEWIFLFFSAAFLVKMPIFPLHGWMPDGYGALPTESVMVYSGVLAKVGAYGFLAIVLPLFPQATVHFQMLMLLVALVSIIYGSAIAFTQTNTRMIAGYSSVAQMGFILLGIFSLRGQGAEGALLQMVNHGLVVAPIFFIVMLLKRRTGGSEDLRDMGGIAMRAPVFAALFLVVALATLAMPGSANFVGEFMILLGTFKSKMVISLIAFSGVVAASVYALRFFIRSMHNRTGPKVHSREIRPGEMAVLAALVAAILFLAFYPQPVLTRNERSASVAVAHPAKLLEAQSTGSAHYASTGNDLVKTSNPGGESE